MKDDRLNILLIMADQFRLDHVGFAHNCRLQTPHINRIAASCAFRGCITSSPMCQPARAALLTGKYPHQIGLATMSGDLSPQHPTYPRALQAAGYQTSSFGKLHLLQGWDWYGKIKGNHNLVALNHKMKDFGFDHVWETSGKFLIQRDYCHWAARLESKGLLQRYFEHLRQCRGNHFRVDEGDLDQVIPWPFDQEDHVDVVTAQKTIEHLDHIEKDRPFFALCSFCGPHVPYDPPSRYLAEFEHQPPDAIFDPHGQINDVDRSTLYRMQKAYKAMVRLIDDQIGQILDKLESLDLMDRTMIIFTSDHGEMLGDHGLLQKGYPQRQSLSIPLAIRHPQYLRGSVNDSPLELIDVCATLLDAAGLDPQTVLSKDWPSYHNQIPCRSLMPIIRGEQNVLREWAFAESDAQWHSPNPKKDSNWQVLQNEEWHYQRFVQIRKSSPETFLIEKLFNRVDDPEYMTDLAGNVAYKDILERCRLYRDFIVSSTPAAQIGWANLET